MPASQRNHHAFECGLLTHSVEVAYCALGVANAFELSNNAKQLIIIGALFHDIAKAAYCADTGELSYQYSDHEQCTIGIVYPALQNLHKTKPLWYETLMAVWSTSSYPRTECSIAKAINMADKISASRQQSCQLFSQKPAHYYFLKDNKVRRLREVE